MSDDEAGAPAPRVAMVLLSVGVSADQVRLSVGAALADEARHGRLRALLAEAQANAQDLVEEMWMGGGAGGETQRGARPGGEDAGGAAGAAHADDEEDEDSLEDAMEAAAHAVVWRVWRWGGEGRMGVVERSRRAVTVENTKRCVPSRLHLRPASRSTHYPTPRGRPMPAGCQWGVGAVAAGFFVVCDTSWWWRWWFFKRPCRECVCELRQQAIFLCDYFALSLMEWRKPKKERGGACL